MRACFTVLAVEISLAACSSSSSTGPSGDAGADATLDGGGDAVVDAPIDAGPCFDEAGNWIFDDKVCAGETDCEAVLHVTDCCGTRQAIGIASTKRAAFDACEAAWEASLPKCGCPPAPTTTEDGKPLNETGIVMVTCTDFTSSGGVCKTSQ